MRRSESRQVRGVRTHLCGWVLLVSMALTLGTSPRSFAQEIAPTGEYDGKGLAVGGWYLFPSIFVGATYDDNFNQSASGTDHVLASVCG